MGSKKIISPLSKVVGYLYNTPLIVEPNPGIALNLIISEIENIGGKVKGVYFGNAFSVEFPLESLKDLSKSRNIKKIRFDGDYKLLKGNSSEEEKFDRYLTELLSFIEQTPIIVRTIDGFKEEDRVKVEELGGKVKNKGINSYSAILPLRGIEDLAEFSRVVHIWYNQPLFGELTMALPMAENVYLPIHPTDQEYRIAEIVAPMVGLRLVKASALRGGHLFLVFKRDDSDEGWGMEIIATPEGLLVSRNTTRKRGIRLYMDKRGQMEVQLIDEP